MSDADGSAAAAAAAAKAPPPIALPPRSAVESIFLRGPDGSPGPMTLVSSFFADGDGDSDCRSFSQLLAGAMASPRAFPPLTPLFGPPAAKYPPPEPERDSAGGGLRFKQNHPLNVVVAAAHPGMFTVPPGLSPTSLLESPHFFSPVQGMGMSHQQALAQVTAQALHNQSQILVGNPAVQTQAPATSSYPSQVVSLQQAQPAATNAKASTSDLPESHHSEQNYQISAPAVDKPAVDGYNWRKYGQKQVKGSEYPRSYYKCTHPNCPVKKKVERSLDGQVTEIIYKGQHNHQKPQSNKRGKEGAVSSSGPGGLPGKVDLQVNSDMVPVDGSGNLKRSIEAATASSVLRRDQELSLVTTEQLSGSTDVDDGGDTEIAADGNDPKKRNVDAKVTTTRVIESSGPQKTVTEPRIIVQTMSEVDLLDDGYRWRKYGQKVVKGNPNPRSYYKCTSAGCNVRKHVERASTDPKAVITTYEGKHNHDIPTARNSSNSTASSGTLQSKTQGFVQQNVSAQSLEVVESNQHTSSLQKLKVEHSMA